MCFPILLLNWNCMVLSKVPGPALTFCSTWFLASCTGAVPEVNPFQLAPRLSVGICFLVWNTFAHIWTKEFLSPYSIVDYVLLRRTNQGWSMEASPHDFSSFPSCKATPHSTKQKVEETSQLYWSCCVWRQFLVRTSQSGINSVKTSK